MALELITTAVGRAQILSALAAQQTIAVQDVQLSATAQPITEATSALQAPVVTLAANGSIRNTASGPTLHLVVTDDGAFAYDLHALALRLANSVVLMAYSQATPIARKASDSALTLSLDLSIDADTAATIVFGDTDFALPAATRAQPGIVRLGTFDEIVSLEGDQVVTAATLGSALGRNRSHNVWLPPHGVCSATPLQLRQDAPGFRVQRGTMGATGAQLRWSLPSVHRRSIVLGAAIRFRGLWPAQNGPRFQLRMSINMRRVQLGNYEEVETIQSDIFQAGTRLAEESRIELTGALHLTPFDDPGVLTFLGLEAVLEFSNVVFQAGHGADTDLIAVHGLGFWFQAPETAPFIF